MATDKVQQIDWLIHCCSIWKCCASSWAVVCLWHEMELSDTSSHLPQEVMMSPAKKQEWNISHLCSSVSSPHTKVGTGRCDSATCLSHRANISSKNCTKTRLLLQAVPSRQSPRRPALLPQVRFLNWKRSESLISYYKKIFWLWITIYWNCSIQRNFLINHVVLPEKY